MLLLSYSLSEREGGGGAPTFLLGVGCVGCAEKSRAGAGDRPAGALEGWVEAVGVPRGARPHMVLSVSMDAARALTRRCCSRRV